MSFRVLLLPAARLVSRNVRTIVLVAVALLLVASRLPAAGVLAETSVARAWASEIEPRVAEEFMDLEHLYEQLHSHPELSWQEEKTAARLAHALAGTGFEITRNFAGHGLVAVLRNGKGPTVLVRTEMDALPVEEKTGLPFASKVRTRDAYGNEVGVMHACGHDVHMTCWVGTARMLAATKHSWSGTLVFIAQPAEERGAGADQMLRDGLYTKFPRPDYCLALHCDPTQASGNVAFTPGLAMANIDTIDITVYGKGGHGAMPHLTVDPIVLASRLVLDLQTLVSRENNPTDPLVITVGSFHGGNKHNIISNEVHLQLTVRTTRDSARKHALEGIARMAKAAAMGAGAPEPYLNIHANSYNPAVLNDNNLTESTVAAFRGALGSDRVHQRPPMMGGEDFALYGRAGVPIFLYFLGTANPASVAQAENDPDHPLPSLHSDLFHPEPEATLKTGVVSMSLAVLNIVGKEPPTHLTRANTPASSRGSMLPTPLSLGSAALRAMSKVR